MKGTFSLIAVMALAIININAQDKLCMSLITGTTKCASCYQSYSDSTSGVCTAPTTAIANAFNYSSATTVLRCNDNYQLGTNACTLINQTTYANAVQLNATNSAIAQCAMGYSTVSNTTNGVTTVSCAATVTANCNHASCSSCQNSNPYDCYVCKTNFVLSKASQTAAAPDTCITGLANCWAGTASACTVCSVGYYINAGSCVKGAVTIFGKLLSLLLVFILQ